jgi:hypothetical protein
MPILGTNFKAGDTVLKLCVFRLGIELKMLFKLGTMCEHISRALLMAPVIPQCREPILAAGSMRWSL